MEYVDCLLEGEEKKRDIFLVLTLWAIVLPIGLYLALSSISSGPPPIDILQNAGVASAKKLLTKRVPIPKGEFSVLLSPKFRSESFPKAKMVAARLPIGAPGAIVAIGVLNNPHGFKAVSPKFTEERKAVYSQKWTKYLEMLRGEYKAGKLVEYRPITAKGLPGFEAHFKEGDVDKRQIELYAGTRCFKFEVARIGAPLSYEDLACFYAVVSSMEDFSELKKILLTQ
mgnify:CR=1 FL=1